MFEKLTLYTYDGEKVADFVIPKWQIPMEVYLWGQRFFIRREDGRYTEARGSYFIPPTQEIVPDVVDEIGSLDTDKPKPDDAR